MNSDAFSISEYWGNLKADNIFSQISTTKLKIKTKDCEETGRYPVVDQGQDKIAGYFNDESKVINIDQPVVIFGDHTRVVKWIDFNFIPGADGVKVLSANNQIDKRFFYYQIRSLELPDKGYARHFKFLKESMFVLPPLSEQKAIAQKLDSLLAQVEATKARLERILEILKQFRQSVLAAAVSGELTEEWRGEKRFPKPDVTHNRKLSEMSSEDEFLLIPTSWTWTRLGSVSRFINGDRGKNYPNKSEYVEQGIPFINTGHIEPDGTLSQSKMNYITKEKFDSLGGGKIKNNDLVYCLRGATMGKTAKVFYKIGAIASSLVIVRTSDFLDSSYAYFFLVSPAAKDLIKKYDNGSAQPNLSAKSLASYAIPLPPMEEQTEIVSRVEQLFTFANKIEQQVQTAQQSVNHLTQSILGQAFSGELTKTWREQNPDLISGENSAEALLERIKAEREKLKPAKKPRKKKKAD